MIHVFPATYVTPSNKAGYVRVTFEVDDENRDSIGDLLNSPMGKQLLMVAYEIGDDAKEIEKLHKDKNHSKNSLMKQSHAIIGEYSDQTGISETKLKQLLKLRLKAKGRLKSSMSELDEQGLAVAVYVLKTELHPSRFDYSEYLNDDENTNPIK